MKNHRSHKKATSRVTASSYVLWVAVLVALTLNQTYAEDPRYLHQLELEAQNSKNLSNNRQKESESILEQDLIRQINTSLDPKKQKKQRYLQQLEHEASDSTTQNPAALAIDTEPESNRKRRPSLSLDAFEKIIIRKQPTVYHFYNVLNSLQKKAVILEYEETKNLRMISKLILDLYSERIKNKVLEQ